MAIKQTLSMVLNSVELQKAIEVNSDESFKLEITDGSQSLVRLESFSKNPAVAPDYYVLVDCSGVLTLASIYNTHPEINNHLSQLLLTSGSMRDGVITLIRGFNGLSLEESENHSKIMTVTGIATIGYVTPLIVYDRTIDEVAIILPGHHGNSEIYLSKQHRKFILLLCEALDLPDTHPIVDRVLK